MRFLVFLAVSVWLAFPVSAEVKAKSGEHVDFSRIVLYFEDPVQWKFGRSKEGYTLVTASDPQEYDLTTIFDYMPRLRVTKVSKQKQGLDFTVPCQCHADVFEYRPGILVLDFKDGPPPQGSVFETGFSADELVHAFDDEASKDNVKQGEIIADESASQPQSGGSVDLGLNSLEGYPLVRGEALRKNLAGAMGRAMTQGVVSASEAQEPVIHEAADLTDSKQEVQISFKTATDLMNAELAVLSQEPDSLDACLDPENFAIQEWGKIPIAPAQLAVAREGLNFKTEGNDHRNIEKAVESYLFLGFGAEAYQVLDNSSYRGDRAELLMAMASQMDEPGRKSSRLLEGQAECNSGGALWALLAHNDWGSKKRFNFDAVFHAVSDLPLHLRRHLAPIVSEKLRRLGQDERAAATRATVSRAGIGNDPSMIVEKARADAFAANPPDLANIVEGNSLLALEVRTEQLAGQLPIVTIEDGQTRAEIEAQIHTAKGSEAAKNLLASYVTALASKGLYEDGFTFLDHLSKSSQSEALGVKSALADLMQSLVSQGSDGQLVHSVASRISSETLTAYPPPLLIEVARRLKTLGFSRPAEIFQQEALRQGGTEKTTVESTFSVPSNLPRKPDFNNDLELNSLKAGVEGPASGDAMESKLSEVSKKPKKINKNPETVLPPTFPIESLADQQERLKASMQFRENAERLFASN